MRRVLVALSLSLVLALAAPAAADVRPSGYCSLCSRYWSRGDVSFYRAGTLIFTLTSGGLSLSTGHWTGSFRAADGTAVLPSYSFTSDPNAGLYSPGPDILGFAVGGAEEARLTDAAFSPGAASGQTLGTAALPWGATFVGALSVTGEVTSTGDVNAAGGYVSVHSGTVLNVPTGSSSISPKAITWRAGSFLGLAVRLDATLITAGSITCGIYEVAALEAGSTVTFTSADASGTIKTATLAKDANPFAAGGAMDVRCVGSGTLAPDGTVDFTASIHFEE